MDYKKIFAFIVIFSLYFTINSILWLNHPPVWPDEAQYADISYNLNTTSKIKSDLQPGILNSEKQIYWYPPFLFYIFSTGYRYLGFSINTQRIFPVVMGALALLFIYFLSVKIIKDKKVPLLILLLLLNDLIFMRASRISRPEMIILALNLVAYYLILKSKSIKSFLIAGILCGLGIILQPYGLISIMIISLYTLITEKQKGLIKLFIFFIPIFLCILWWFYKIDFKFDYWLVAMKANSMRKALEKNYFQQLFEDSDKWLSWLHMTFFIASIYSFVYLLFKSISNKLFVLLGLAVSWLFVFMGKQHWYFVYFIPFFYLSYFLIIKNEIKTNRRVNLILSSLILVTIVIINLHFSFVILKSLSRNNFSYDLYAKTITQKIPNKAHVFVSSIPDPYFELRKNKTLKITQFTGLPGFKKEYLNMLERADYVVYNGTYDYVYGDLLKNYIKDHTLSTLSIDNGPDQYQGYLIKLKK